MASLVLRCVILMISALVLLSGCQAETVPTQTLPAPLKPSAAVIMDEPPINKETPVLQESETPSIASIQTHKALPTADNSVRLTLAAQHGGTVTGVAISPEDMTAYVALGHSVFPLSISDPSHIQKIGEGFPLNHAATDLALQEEFLYLIDNLGHLYVFHVTDPETMYVTQAFEGAGSSRIFLQQDWGFVFSDTCVEGNCMSLLKLFSLSELPKAHEGMGQESFGPPLPVVATAEIPGAVQEAASDGKYVYVAHENGLLIASLPDLKKVAEISSKHIGGAAFDLPYAYLAGESFLVINLLDPSNPEQIQTAQDINPGQPITISGNRLYSFDTFGEFGLCWSTLVGLDITNPAAPFVAYKQENETGLACPHLMKASGERLFVIDWNGLAVIDIAEPDMPKPAGKFSNNPAAVKVANQGILYSMIDRGSQSLWVHDARNLEEIKSYGPFDPRWVLNPARSGNTLYAPVWQDGLAIIDISDPLKPSVVNQIGLEELQGPGLDASFREDYLYIAREENGVGVLDVSRPHKPVLVGEFIPVKPENTWVNTSRVTAGDRYVVSLETFYHNDEVSGQLRFLNFRDPKSPVDAGTLEIGRNFDQSDLIDNGRTAIAMISGCGENNACWHKILLVDLDSPTHGSMFEMPGEAFELYVQENYLYVAAGKDGLYIWKIANLANPVLAAHLSQLGFVQNVVVDGEWVYVSEAQGGLRVYQQVIR